MTYYINEYNATTNPTLKKMIALADEIITLYESGTPANKEASVRKSKELIACYDSYIGIAVGDRNEEIARKFKNKLNLDYETARHEIEIARHRALHVCKNGADEVDEFGFAHTARFADWLICIFGLVKIGVFHEDNKRYLADNERTFSRSEEKQFKGRKMIFYRNAYRAEAYSHNGTMLDPEGGADMYTPLILMRMATEQYIKYMYEKHLGKLPPYNDPLKKGSIPSLTTALATHGIISKMFAHEILAVNGRGNLNTHYGYPGYVISNRHGIDVIKKCFEDLKKN